MNPTSFLIFAIGVLLGCTVIVLTAWEIVRFRRGESLLDRRQLTLRGAGALLLTTLIVQICGGLAFVRYVPDPTRANPRAAVFFMGYWLICGVLTIVLLLIVRIDFILLARKRLEAERKLAREQLARPSAAGTTVGVNGAPRKS